eukprot:CAMPEP_0172495532 /NCGR_PEP_ID=MMETSP1066-20121228/71450_1 /TAXON_ID=671091 /ORGANISM="Coscinodiscus wailesii, Strain CCMP2513" /LENGTH=453 /DNA_ID=CAMNT_0013267269 /DNA_START=143 /DNA_END=1504 /DNA_ORIENTATION=+
MISPRSRNWYAYEAGRDDRTNSPPGTPPREYCSHCLNSKLANQVCGLGNAQSYDDWNDLKGDPMPWMSQGNFVEGQEILVHTQLTTNHAGHMELMICPLEGDESASQECFDSHPLRFVRDICYGGPADDIYPVRGYYSTNMEHYFIYKLPTGISGSRVLMQWRYITANSCIPPGYFNPDLDLAGRGWLRGFSMAGCNNDEQDPPQLKLDPTGSGAPEQFWNCAEISIEPLDGSEATVSTLSLGTDICPGGGGPSPPTHVAPSPVWTAAPVSSPMSSPVWSQPTPTSQNEGYCNWGFDGTAVSSTCDGCVQGGSYCNSNAFQCEESCSGKWCTNPIDLTCSQPIVIQPTSPSPPPASSPMANPVSAPVIPPPVSESSRCCVQNYKECIASEWCNESQMNCEGSCSGKWSDVSVIPRDCIAKHGVCMSSGNGVPIGTCCPGLTCKGDQWWASCVV